MRSPHFLDANKQGEIPVRCLFFDCETYSVPVVNQPGTTNQKLWFGYAAFVRRKANDKWTAPRWHRFTTPASFWEWAETLVKGKTALYTFAHNLGFDVSVSEGFQQLWDRAWKPSRFPILDDPPTCITYRKKRQSIKLLDTLNFFRVPLKVLGDSVGLPKLDMPERSASQKIWNQYCKRDVEIIMYTMLEWLKFVQTEELGNFAKTLPGQAFSAFRHRFMNHRIFIDANTTALALARESFHGGRTECFQIGKIPMRVYCLDINSQYPYVMQKERFPTRLLTVVKHLTIEELQELLETRAIVARVILKTERPIYATKPTERLVFPIGEFEAVLSTPELQIALENNEIQEIKEAAVYIAEPLFEEYVTYFYTARALAKQDGNETASYMYKLLMNSLYGKFGQSGRVFEDIGATDEHGAKVWSEWDTVEQRNRRFRMFFGLIQEESREAEGRNSHPAIAAHVTAYGRVYLYRLMEQAGRDHVFYCDTDSLFVDSEGLENLRPMMDETRLGALKQEWYSDDLHLHNNKDYEIGKERKIKGVRKTAVEVAPGVFKQDKFQSLKGKFQEGQLDQQKISEILKHYSRAYLKGTVDDDGVVRPFRLNGISTEREGVLV
jgi:hypothetical protein